MSVEELEYCYYEYACMTGCLPAGGLEFIDDALGYGVFAQLVHRECHAD